MDPGKGIDVDLLDDGLLFAFNILLLHPTGYALILREDGGLGLGRASDGWFAFDPDLAREKAKAFLDLFDGDMPAQSAMRELMIKAMSLNVSRIVQAHAESGLENIPTMNDQAG